MDRRLRIGILAGVLLLGAQSAGADETQGWFSYNFQGSFNDRLGFSSDNQLRTDLGRHDFDRIVIRPGITWKLDERWTVAGGYVWSNLITPFQLSEHRTWQGLYGQLVSGESWGLNLRVRLEERFVEGFDPTGLRLRTQLRATRRFGQSSPWSMALAEEVAFTLKEVPPVSEQGFEFSRSFAGITRKLTKRNSLEAGYLLQMRNGLFELPYRRYHALQVGVSTKF